MNALKKLIPLIIIAALVATAWYIYNTTRDTGFGPAFATGNGRLEATEIDVSAKLAGRLIDVRADEGDFVKSGQVLAVMQTDTLEAKLNEAKAQVVKANAALAGTQAQVAVRESDVNAARATVAQKQSELEQTRRRLERSSVLSEKGVITGQEFDDDETSEMAAQAAVYTAQANVKVAQAAVAAAEADVRGAEAVVKAQEAAVASIQADIADSFLKAPRDGRVQYRIAQPGEVVGAGGKVINFVDLSDVYMNFFLPSEQAGRLRVGSEARIILDAYRDIPVPAVISFVSDQAQFTPKTVETESERQKLMFRVKAKVPPEFIGNHREYVKTGMPGIVWTRIDESQPWPEELAVKNPVAQAAK